MINCLVAIVHGSQIELQYCTMFPAVFVPEI